jgi:hypothetical protein
MSTGMLIEPPRTTEDLANTLWSNLGVSGVQISGDAGSGKSVFAQQCFRSLARESQGALLVIDPPGDYAKACRNDTLHLGKSVANRTHYIKYGDADMIVPINPLHVRHTADANKYQARLSCRVAHCAHLLLSAWGQDSWDGTPLLFKWTTLFLNSLAKMGLPMAEVRHFLNPHSEVFRQLAEHVPDYFAQMELARLIDLKPDKVLEQLQSTANRFLGFFDNPIVEATLGFMDGCVDVRQMIRDKQIVIIDLEPCGQLREEDVQILANIWLAEWLHEVFTAEQQDRCPTAIICDELPVFRPSFNLIERSLRMRRKTLTRFFGLHQGTQGFPNGTDDPLLHHIVGQTGIKAYFRHVDPVDNQFFGDVLAIPQLDPHKEKFRHMEREQYHAGYDVITLVDRVYNAAYSETEGGSTAASDALAENWNWGIDVGKTDQKTDASGSGATFGVGHTDNEATNESCSNYDGASQDQRRVSQAYNNAVGNTRGATKGSADTVNQSQTKNRSQSSARGTKVGVKEGGGGSRTSTRDAGHNWQRSVNRGASVSYRQQLMASAVARQRTGQCLVYVAGVGVAQVEIPFASDPFAGTPRTLQKKLAAYFEQLHQLPQYHQLAAVIEYRRQLLPNVIRELRKLGRATAYFEADNPHSLPTGNREVGRGDASPWLRLFDEDSRGGPRTLAGAI